MRPSWDEHFMRRAYLEASMSTCASGRKVGAVFVRGKHGLISGFNGPPSKYPHPETCTRRDQGVPSGQGLDLCPCKHAEENGITTAARYGVSLEGTTCYVTCMPCASCMGMLVNAGVREVVYDEEYQSPISSNIAYYGGIRVRRFREDGIYSKECRKCGGDMAPGVALVSGYKKGMDDFIGDSSGGVVTMSVGGPGKMEDVMKCKKCGYSVKSTGD